MPIPTLTGYTVLEKIRDGSVGTVWRVKDARGRILAAKQISAKKAKDPAKLKRFRKEFAAQAKLAHPAVIKAFDYVRMPPQDFFTMEYFDGEGLKLAMFSLPDRVHTREFRILRRLAEGLVHVHESGLIHKDLKPDNVLVDVKGDVRLIDFSLSQTAWDRLLQFGRRAEGTPLYMAPEQVEGKRCDRRTDLYAFGLIMFELLTKRLPFQAKDQDSVMRMHLKQAPPPLSDHVRGADPELEALVLRLLDKDPSKRGDLDTVIVALRRWENADLDRRRRQVVAIETPCPVPPAFG
jgi:serine/threonine-protein kinase